MKHKPETPKAIDWEAMSEEQRIEARLAIRELLETMMMIVANMHADPKRLQDFFEVSGIDLRLPDMKTSEKAEFESPGGVVDRESMTQQKLPL